MIDQPNTSSPTTTPVASGPTASTTPATSLPGIFGNCTDITSAIDPDRSFQSIGFTPAARMTRRTWLPVGSGTGTSWVSSTSGPP